MREKTRIGKVGGARGHQRRAELSPGTGRGAFRVEDRNGKIKPRALADFAFHPDAAAVRLDEMLGDGQAKSRAAYFTGAGGVHAVKAFENAWLVGSRNADAGV